MNFYEIMPGHGCWWWRCVIEDRVVARSDRTFRWRWQVRLDIRRFRRLVRRARIAA